MIPFKEKCEKLRNHLKKFEKVAIAFSGGKDSFFLSKMAVDALGADNVLAMFAIHPFTSTTDFRRIEYFSKKLVFQLRSVKVNTSGDPHIWMNSRDRCYHCKKNIFRAVQIETRECGFQVVLEGTTHSDLSEYRPGLVALEELQVKSPLKDMGITSEEIKCFLADSGIEPFFLNSSACLATRFPYGHELSASELKQFDDLESFFINEGIFPIRVRMITDGIRIETPVRLFDKIRKSRTKIIDYCHSKGIKWITLDIEGLKSGSWD